MVLSPDLFNTPKIPSSGTIHVIPLKKRYYHRNISFRSIGEPNHVMLIKKLKLSNMNGK